MLFSLPSLLLLALGLAAAAPHQQEERRNDAGFYDSWSRKGHNFRGRGSSRAAEQCVCNTGSVEIPLGM